MNRRKLSHNSLPLTIFVVSSLLSQVEPVWAQTATTAPSVGTGAASSYTDLGYGQYPRVTEIEQQLLGKTYEKDPLTTRVARLETKQFGKPSPNDDLADRLDKLDKFITPKTQMASDDNGDAGSVQSGASGNGVASASTGADSGAASAAPAASGHVSTDSQYSASDYGNYPRVTELEQQFLGTTYVKDPLPVRIARLETKKFGKTTPNDDLCDRIDRLDKLANPHQNSRMADSEQGSGSGGGGGNGNSNSNKGGVASSIGRSLLGMLGGAMGGGMGGLGGMGMGMMGNRMGGVGGNGMGNMMPGVQDDMKASSAKNQQGGGGAGTPPARAQTAIQSPFAPDAPAISGTENKLAAIEKFVLGKEHPEAPLAERVAHVEKKLVPYEHHQASQDVGLRVDHLWSILAAANKPSTKSVAAAQGSSQE